MDIKILVSAIFLVAGVFSVIGSLWALFTAFSKKSSIFLFVSLLLFIVPLWIAR